MSERLIKVKLYGHLRKFGREFELFVKSPAEAVHAIGVMVPGFKHFLETSEQKGMTFAVFNGRRNISEEELALGAQPEIRIAPVYGGRKNGGVFQTIMGAILIAAGVVGNVFYPGNPVSPFLINAGIAMVVGGVIQMLSPTAGGLKTQSDDENTAAYAFGGPINTTAQGTPVGILYGQREVGGAIISAGIFAEDRA